MSVRLYARVSTAEQTEQFSLAFQQEKGEAWARFQDLKPVYLYEERGVSGRRDDRPELLRLLDELREGDTVVVYALSRLGRGGAVQLLGIVERIKAKGARLVSLTESIDTETPSGRLLLVILATVAELELETTRERTIEGRVQAARQGVWPHAAQSLPFGYAKDAQGRVVPGERADDLRLIFELAAGGTPFHAVAQVLNERGVPARKGGTWRNTVVASVVTEPCYASGTYMYRRYLYPERPEMWIPFSVPPLVSQAIWDAAQRPKMQNHVTRDASRYPLTGHIFCECGTPLAGNGGHARKNHPVRWLGYACAPKSRRTPTCPATGKVQPSFGTEKVEGWVRAALVEAFGDLQTLAMLASNVTPPPDPHQEERAMLERRKVHLVDLYMDELIVREEYVRRLGELERRLRELVLPVPEPVEIPPRLEGYVVAAETLEGEAFAQFLGELQARFTVSRTGVKLTRLSIPG